MTPENMIVKWLMDNHGSAPALDGVRFGTKKLPVDYKPAPDVEVVIKLVTPVSRDRTWQAGAATIGGMLLIHTYSVDEDRGKQVAWHVCMLLDGLIGVGSRKVSVNRWPDQMDNVGRQAFFYANADILL